jgi:PEP-CTERM motif
MRRSGPPHFPSAPISMRVLSVGLLTLALVSSPLSAYAQTPTVADAPVAAWIGGRAVFASYNGGPASAQAGPYQMRFGGIFGNAIADIYCVDFANDFGQGVEYEARITALSNDANTFASRTRIGLTLGDGSVAKTRYLQLAWLASHFETEPTSAWQGIHGAIWSMNGNFPDPALNPDVALWLDLLAGADLSTVDQNAWAVVTDMAVTGPNGGSQEFLVRGNVVPEPSTYALMLTGFAGLAIAARRRRRV